MPNYEYVCDSGHVTEQRGGYDDADILCPEEITCTYDCDNCAPYHVCGSICGRIATRRPGYKSQGVIFSGVGFTKTVIPPAPPQPTTIPGEPTADWLDKTDTFAQKQYQDDKEYRDERKKQAKEMIDQVKRGKIL